MIKHGAEYFKCPYCDIGKTNIARRQASYVGMYKIKITPTNILVLQCVRCKEIFRLRCIGSALTWKDMSKEEQMAFDIKELNYVDKKAIVRDE